MTAIPVILILSCLFILGSSRPRVAIQVVAIQGLFLGMLPLIRSAGHLTSAILILGLSGILFKGILLPLLMQTVLKQTGIQRESAPYVAFGSSILTGVMLLALSAWLAVSLGLPATTSLVLTATAMFLILVGLFLMISRRLSIMQTLAYLVLENGVYALGISISLEFPLIVELGILLDIFVAVFLMGNLLFHMDREFEKTDAGGSNEPAGLVTSHTEDSGSTL
jgi:hydrogenase-4 component E